MDKRKSRKQQNEPIKVLYFYQYDHDLYPNGLPIHVEFDEIRSSKKSKRKYPIEVYSLTEIYDSWSIEENRKGGKKKKRKKDEKDGDDAIYSQLKKAVTSGEYPLAFALITEDERHASSAGNLFFEIGFWQACRGEKTIRIVRHNKVPRLTNISNQIMPEIKNGEEAWKKLEILVGRWLKHNPYDDKCSARTEIKQVFKCTKDWAKSDFSECRTRDNKPNCDVRHYGPGVAAVLKREGNRIAHLAALHKAICRICEISALFPNKNGKNFQDFMLTQFKEESLAFLQLADEYPFHTLSLSQEEAKDIDLFFEEVKQLYERLQDHESLFENHSWKLRSDIITCFAHIQMKEQPLNNVLRQKVFQDWNHLSDQFDYHDHQIEPRVFGDHLRETFLRLVACQRASQAKANHTPKGTRRIRAGVKRA